MAARAFSLQRSTKQEIGCSSSRTPGQCGVCEPLSRFTCVRNALEWVRSSHPVNGPLTMRALVSGSGASTDLGAGMARDGAHVIVVGNEKGGSGKSTTAFHLAVYL